MRLNRGTIILLLVSAVIIVAVVVVNNQRATAPDITPASATGTPAAGPVFPQLADAAAQGNIVRLEVTKSETSEKTVLTKDDAGVWTVAEATNTLQLATDQTRSGQLITDLATLAATDKFAADNLADFGLDKPVYTIVMTAKDNTAYTIQIGKSAATNPRYYATVNDDAEVYVLPKDLIDKLVGSITMPPYVDTPTPTPTPTATANPYSEVEMTQTAAVEMTAFYQMLTATAESVAEATGEATAEATAETTAETTAEATSEATVEATPEATIEATAEKVKPTLQIIAPAASPTPTATPTAGS